MKKVFVRSLTMMVAAIFLVQPGWGQQALKSTTLSANVEITDNQIKVASAPSGVAAGWLAYVNREAMIVQAVSGNTLTVRRAAGTQALKHTSGDTIYIDEAQLFGLTQIPSGRCVGSDTLATPVININTGEQFKCQGGIWTVAGGAPAAFSQMIITSTNANSLTSGPNGTTNPSFNVDASTASAATGLGIKAAAAGGGLAASVTSSGANEALTVDAKGTGTLTLNGTATGGVTTPRALTSSGATGGVGYATGAGGTVTQLTSKSTGVTLNKVTGQITMNGAALAAATSVGFTLTNSAIAATDVVIVNIASGATANAYQVTVEAVAAGSCQIQLRNESGAALSEALVLNFAVVKGVSS